MNVDQIQGELHLLDELSSLAEFQNLTFAINTANGWYEDIESRTLGDDCMLLISEASELFEEHRNGHRLMEVYYTHDKNCPNIPGQKLAGWEQGIVECCIPKPEGIPTEAADLLIRLLDFCKRRGINLAAETKDKLSYNLTRGYRHGGKVI